MVPEPQAAVLVSNFAMKSGGQWALRPLMIFKAELQSKLPEQTVQSTDHMEEFQQHCRLLIWLMLVSTNDTHPTPDETFVQNLLLSCSRYVDKVTKACWDLYDFVQCLTAL